VVPKPPDMEGSIPDGLLVHSVRTDALLSPSPFLSDRTAWVSRRIPMAPGQRFLLSWHIPRRLPTMVPPAYAVGPPSFACRFPDRNEDPQPEPSRSARPVPSF
jgi:hypothetical protein